jgi:hypothetical protein
VLEVVGYRESDYGYHTANYRHYPQGASKTALLTLLGIRLRARTGFRIDLLHVARFLSLFRG